MSFTNSNSNVGYGLLNPTGLLASLPIFANRYPIATDIAPLGQLWVVEDQIFMLTAALDWVEVGTGGQDVFSNLTVTGASTFNGSFIINSDQPVTLNSGTSATNISTQAVNTATIIGNTIGATSVHFIAGTGGIQMNASGLICLQGALKDNIQYPWPTNTGTSEACIGCVNYTNMQSVITNISYTFNINNYQFSLNPLVGLLVTLSVKSPTNSGGALRINGVILSDGFLRVGFIATTAFASTDVVSVSWIEIF